MGVKALGAKYWDINELTFDHVNVGVTYGGIGVWLDHAIGVKISDCAFTRAGKEGLRVNNGYDISAVNTDFDYCGQNMTGPYTYDGVLFANVTNSRIVSSWIGAHGGRGLVLCNSSRISVTGNTLAENGFHGIMLDNTNYTTLTANTLSRNGLSFLKGHSLVYDSIRLQTSQYCTLSANTCRENMTYAAIRESGGSDFNIIMSNIAFAHNIGISVSGANTTNVSNIQGTY